MSKIEDALNKIEISKGKGLSVIRSNNELKSTGIDSNSNDLSIVHGDANSAVAHSTSVKNIALMKNNELLDNSSLSEMKVIFTEMPDSKIADSYRDLRTKLIQKSHGKNVSVMLTSCVSGYYSSSIALNLSAAFSFDESKTSLIIDCNLNNPQLYQKLKLEPSPGLTDYLENDKVPIDSILQESGIKRLRVIPSGTARETATEYFTSLRMRNLMSKLLNRYSDRYIFIDSAPIVDSADTRILVELCEYVILVVPYGKATKKRIKEAAEAIGSNKLLGVVFADKPAIPFWGRKWFKANM